MQMRQELRMTLRTLAWGTESMVMTSEGRTQEEEVHGAILPLPAE